MKQGDAGRLRWLKGYVYVALVGLLTAFAAVAPPARAAINEEPLFRFGSGFGGGPAVAGKLQFVQGIVADPVTGHVYLGSTGENNRVDEFTPWGEFVKAFGWDVAPGAVNEVQELRVRASAGTFKLSFGAALPTPDLPFNATGKEVKDALDALSTIGGAGGSVDVVEHVGAPDGSVPYVYIVTFKGSLAGSDVTHQIEAANGSTPLAGGSPTTVLDARTRADGTPGGTGLESCTSESGCKAGSEGGGAGQLRSVFGAAIDASGEIYVRDFGNNRVQKFSPDGHFLLTFGGNVNKTKVEAAAPEAQRNICTALSGDVCQAGTVGAGNGQFEAGFGVAVIGSAVYVGDKGRIQKFDQNGIFLGNLPDPGGVLSGKTVQQLAADPASGRLYVFRQGMEKVAVLNATSGALIREQGPSNPNFASPLVVDAKGDMFGVEDTKSDHHRPNHVVEFDPNGKQLIPDNVEEEECKKAEEVSEAKCKLFAAPEAGYELRGIGVGPEGDFYVANVKSEVDSFIRVFGPPPLGFESPLPMPPSIDAQYAAAVSDVDAEVRAQINPHFFAGVLGPTTYFVQYATAACIEDGGWGAGCVKEKPASPGATLKAGVVDEDITVSLTLTGLASHTAYRYRFVAEGNGVPGAEIIGLEGKEGMEGKDSGFLTYTSPSEVKVETCSNEAFRDGASAALPDCRAYEMVSPVDKEGGEIRVLGELSTSLPAVLNQSAGSGDALAYGSYKSFGDAQSALYTTQYIASRGVGGWVSRAISAPQSTQIIITVGTFDTEFKFFSEDLCQGWLRTYADPPLAAGAVPGYSNLYRRENCTEAPLPYEALTSVKPMNGVKGPLYELELQGLSGDGQTAIYAAGGQLTGNAPNLVVGQRSLYVFQHGEVEPRYVCILPGGSETASSKPCTAGAQGGPASNRGRRVEHAISEGGSRIFWTGEEGAIYLRKNPFAAGPECSGEATRCTVAVAGKGSQYWGAAKDGSVAIYANGGSLFEFELNGAVSRKIAGELTGVVGMGEDASRIYFVSREDLDGTGPALAGQPNLYLRDGGQGAANMRFIGTLAAADVNPPPGRPSTVAAEPWLRATQVSGDGQEAAFMSFASLKGYDNHDLISGQADAEVYFYRSTAKGGVGALVCASCNPAGTRPVGRNIGVTSPFWVAAQIPVPENNLHEARLITDNGKRLYFETTDSLALRDSNGAKDIYQWEEAGAGGCGEGDPSYVAAAEGCVNLISSGQSLVDSEFTEASPDGANVFFTTLSSLVPQDPGVPDVYDAREKGGLPTPAPEPPECEGENCQNPQGPPVFSTPSSSTYEGPGNVAKQGKKPCPKGKVRRQGRCVKKHKAKHKHKQGGGK
jgi:hypothetical protein